MPRRYTNKARKSSNRKYKRVSFSRYSTYRNRGSKAQAKQIYTLNRRVNAMYKSLKPETQVLSINPDSSIQVVYGNTQTDQPEVTKILELTSLTGGINYVKIKNISLYVMASLTNCDTSLGDNINLRDYVTTNVYFRLVVFRAKADATAVPNASEIINSWARTNSPNTDVLDYKAKWFGPLRSGLTTQYSILLDRKFSLNQNYVQHNKHYRFKCNYKFERTNESQDNQHKGSIYALIWAYNPDAATNPQNYCNCKLYAKQAFINANPVNVAGPTYQN